MKWMIRLAVATIVLFSATTYASDILMVRSSKSFPEAMLALQLAITEQGYTVSRVQRVDIGLTKSGYHTDEYRVVFFGKNEELQQLTEKYPDLIPYLPWKILIFAEQDETLIVAHNPSSFSSFLPHPELKQVFEKWQVDILSIMEKTRLSDD